MLKPHRIVTGRISLYRREVTAFLYRRQRDRREFVRIERRDGSGIELSPGEQPGRNVMAAARDLLG